MTPDRLIDERVLFTGEQVADAARVEGDHHRAKDAGRPRLVVHTNAKIHLDPPEQDLSRYNVLVVHLKLARPFDGTLVTRLRCATRQPGMAVNDIYSNVVHFNQPSAWRGWQRVFMPAVNLVATGFPDGWKQIQTIELDLHGRVDQGQVTVGAIELQRIASPAGPRMSDDELLDALDLDQPALRSVARHAARARTADAIAALAKAMRKLPQPPLSAVTGKASLPTSKVDEIHRNHILGQQLPARIDWHCNPVGYLEWNHAFNRHSWMVPLADAFRATNAAKHASKLDSLMRTWIEQNPEPIGHNGGLDPAWETLSTSLRINRPWPHVLDVARRSDALRDRTVVDMLKMIHAHAEHLLGHWGHNNWYVSESTALVTAGATVPFFRRASHWMKQGMTRLEREMQRQVFPDGAQFELSPNYHTMCAELFSNARQRAAFRGHEFSTKYTTRLAAMYDYLVGITRPDGSYPVPNDAGGALPRGNTRLLDTGRSLRRDDWIWAGSGGAAGKRPDHVGSVHYPDAGHAVMRSGWRDDDRWAFIDLGQFGASHQHEDKLHVDLYAYHTPFLVDPGISSYQADPVVSHFRTSTAHNTIDVDGKSQWRRRTGDVKTYQSSNRGHALWASGSGLDLAQATYDEAYGDLARHVASTASGAAGGVTPLTGTSHTRTLVFVRPDYWLILDTVAGSGIHEAAAHWHFTPMHVRVDDDAAIIRTQRLSLPNLELICRADWHRAAKRIVTGKENPVQGFIALQGDIKPAPCAVVARRKRLPLHGVTVAIPFATGSESHARVTTRAVRQGKSQGMVIDVRHEHGGRDRFLWRHTGRGTLNADDLTASATLAAARYDDADRLRYVAVVDGTSMRCGSVTLKGKPNGIAERTPRPHG
ncbi:MAG: alginate lyase family protein [Phycisphaeraceae bacterium]